MAPDTSALRLAELRARGAIRASGGRAELERAAALAGRQVVDAGERWVLAFEQPVDPRGLGLEVRELSTLPLVVLGVCIGLAWTDRPGRLYPGEAVPVSDVLASLAALGAASVSHQHHIMSAIDGELRAAGLIERAPGGTLRLGPALAAWPQADVESLRRAGGLLPEPAGD